MICLLAYFVLSAFYPCTAKPEAPSLMEPLLANQQAAIAKLRDLKVAALCAEKLTTPS